MKLCAFVFGLAVVGIVWLGIWVAQYEMKFKKACDAKGGVYKTFYHSSSLCFEKGVLK